MKIITALDDNKINNEIQKNKKIEIIYKNVQYREAILEILQKTKNIDIIIIDENIPGEISLIDLINKIKIINNKIRIIIILEEKNIKKEKMLEKNNIKEIYYKKELKNKKIIDKINLNNKIKNNKNNKIKIISFFGKKKIYLIIKLIFRLLNKNKKILLLDFNNSKIKNYIFLIIKENLEVEEIKIEKEKQKKLNKIKGSYYKKFDYILVNTKDDEKTEINSKILRISNQYVIAIEANLAGIEYIKEFNEKYENNYIKNRISLHIIENKNYFLLINYKIIRNVFYKFKKINRIKEKYFYKSKILKQIKNINI